MEQNANKMVVKGNTITACTLEAENDSPLPKLVQDPQSIQHAIARILTRSTGLGHIIHDWARYWGLEQSDISNVFDYSTPAPLSVDATAKEVAVTTPLLPSLLISVLASSCTFHASQPYT